MKKLKMCSLMKTHPWKPHSLVIIIAESQAQSDLGDLQSLVKTVQHLTQNSTIMQTAHILCLTTLDMIQVGQSAVSHLE